MKNNIHYNLIILFLLLMSCEMSAQRYFEADNIRYRVVVEADDASTYGTVSVAKPEFGEYEDDIVIPKYVSEYVNESEDDDFDTYQVVGIDDEAFYNAKHLGSVTLSETIKTIGVDAFRYSSLSSITIPMGSLTAISDGAFGSTQLITVEIPSSVKMIGDQAFQNCYQLGSVSFGKGVESIGKGAFTHSSITTLVFPESLRTIGNNAFSDCILLHNVTLSKNLKYIGDEAFSCCFRLRSLDLPKGLKMIGEKAFAASGIIDITIPETVKEIKKYCFAGSFIRTIRLHDKQLSIDQSAFDNCDMDTLIIPSTTTITNINYGEGFYELFSENQKSVIEEEFDHLDDESKYAHIQYVTGTETNFGANRKQAIREKFVANNDSKLTKKSVKYSDLEFFKPWNGRIQFKIDGISYSPIQYPSGKEQYGLLLVSEGKDARGNIIIPDIIEITDGPYDEKYIVTIINAGAFDQCAEIKGVNLPTTIEEVGISAFRNSGITSITFPPSLTTIPSGLFCGCKDLISISIPNTITKIGTFAFDRSGLFSISLPSSIDTIENNAFSSCENLTSVTLPSSLLVLGARCFYDCPLTNITLPDSLLSIGPSCFERCPLTHVTIPQNVELIDDDAFQCDSLTRVEILGDPSRLWVGYRIFGNNKDLKITVVPTITK